VYHLWYIGIVETGKRIQVRFYHSASGNEPVRDWLMKLSRKDRLTIGTDIKTVEFGWPVGLPVCRSLGGGLWEVRSSVRNRIARVLFCVEGGRMWLLHGFMKKQQKAPPDEMNLARKRMREIVAAANAGREGRRS